MNGLEIFDKGGPLMYLLAGLSIYILAVIFYKIYQFVRVGLGPSEGTQRALGDLANGHVKEAQELLAREVGPVARVMETAIAVSRDTSLSHAQKEEEISRVGTNELRHLESHLRGLEMIANIAPLLGLLGTVSGMIAAFERLSSAGVRIDPGQLAGGIWVALLTTAAGLAVATPALAAHYLVDGGVERQRAAMKDMALRVLALEGVITGAGVHRHARDAAPGEMQTLELLNPRYHSPAKVL